VKLPITVDYDGDLFPFDVYSRPLWDWCKELLMDRSIVSQFEWNAQRLWKYHGVNQKFVRFYDEPWTADDWWTYQVSTNQ